MPFYIIKTKYHETNKNAPNQHTSWNVQTYKVPEFSITQKLHFSTQKKLRE